MIYMFMALYAEAKPLIEQLKLKKVNSGCKFMQYSSANDVDEYICLTITGMGSVAASTAVGAVCACRELTDTDVILNIGTAAGNTLMEKKTFLIHKIVEQATGRTFYPDVLYHHPFDEAELVSVPKVLCNLQNQDIISEVGVRLFDMEAAAIYQAGNYFVGPHQMKFIKIISDAGAEQRITQEQLTECVERCAESIIEYIHALIEAAKEWQKQSELFSQEEQRWLEQLCTDLHCSATMQASVEQLCRYWKLAGVDYTAYISRKYREGILPCKDKREGKRLMDEWKSKLL